MVFEPVSELGRSSLADDVTYVCPLPCFALPTTKPKRETAENMNKNKSCIRNPACPPPHNSFRVTVLRTQGA